MAKFTEKLVRVTRIGLDLAKTVFQVHGVDATGKVVIARKLRRGTMEEFFGRLAPCVVAMEACSSAHHWGRQLGALGHEVKLIPPAHVKPYLRRNKTDAADAAAICEAAMRPGQRFVAVRSIDNQAAVMRHRVRASEPVRSLTSPSGRFSHGADTSASGSWGKEPGGFSSGPAE